MQQKKQKLGVRCHRPQNGVMFFEVKDYETAPSIHAAVVSGQQTLVEELIDLAADVNARDENNWPPLHFAAKNGLAQIADILLLNGADSEATVDSGMTALHLAAVFGWHEVIDVLLRHGARLDAEWNGSMRALEIAASRGNTEALQTLVQYIGDLSEHPVMAGPALHVACRQDNVDCVKVLVEAGANIELRLGLKPYTPLLLALSCKSYGSARMLLDSGADVEAVLQGQTPLMLAVSEGALDMLTLLIQHGANIDAEDHDGLSVLQQAVSTANHGVAAALLQHRVRLNPASSVRMATALHIAILKQDSLLVRMLLCKGSDTELCDSDGDAALHLASMTGDLRTVALLLQHGANINHANPQTGKVPLQIAMERGNSEVVEYLLSHRADKTFVDMEFTRRHATAASSDSSDPRRREFEAGHASTVTIKNEPSTSVMTPVIIAKDGATDQKHQRRGESQAGSPLPPQSLPTTITEEITTEPEKVVTEPKEVTTGPGEVVTESKEVVNEPEEVVTEPEKVTTEPEEVTTEPEEVQRSQQTQQPTLSESPHTSVDDTQATSVQVASPQAAGLQPARVASPGPASSVAGSMSPAVEDKGLKTQRTIRFPLLEIQQHLPFKPSLSALTYEVQHEGVTCDGVHCKNKSGPLQGIRYCCVCCDNVDLCSLCAESWFEDHSTLHAMVRILLPSKVSNVQNADEATKLNLVKLYEGSELTAENWNGLIYVETDLEHLYPILLEMESKNRLPTEDALRRVRSPEVVPVFFKPDQAFDPQLYEEGKPEPNSVAMYKIDDAFNVRIRYQAKGSTPHHVSRERTVGHADDESLLRWAVGEMKPYKYSSDEQFYQWASDGRMVTRVIDLKPGGPDEKLEINLRTVDLLQNPAYQALSYTWKTSFYDKGTSWKFGTAETLDEVMLVSEAVYLTDKAGNDCYLCVGPGLHDALKRLRDRSKVVTLWVDQLSINQHDLSERALQVSRMRLCYGRAAEVILWTGEHDDFTASVFELYRKLAFSALQRKVWLSPNDLEPVDVSILEAAVKFHSRPVFSRIWCVQEVVVGSAVVLRCGEYSISYDDFMVATRVMATSTWTNTVSRLREKESSSRRSAKSFSSPSIHSSPLNGVTLVSRMRIQFQKDSGLALETLLFNAGQFQSSDPRDKVFAVLGLQTNKVPIQRIEEIGEQYNYSEPTAETFRRGTATCIWKSNSLNICGMNSSLTAKLLPDLPSWVPDYTANELSLATSFSRPKTIEAYSASGQVPHIAAWPYPDRLDLLVTSSCIADSITVVSQHCCPPENASTGELVLEWGALSDKCKRLYPTGESRPEAFGRTLVADNTNIWTRQPPSETLLRSLSKHLLKETMTHLISGDEDQKWSSSSDFFAAFGSITMVSLLHDVKGAFPDWHGKDSAEHSAEVWEAAVAFEAACDGRRFFVTAEGYMGIGPRDMESGDEVHILSGASVPFVMRAVNENEDPGTAALIAGDDLQLYRMVGECYVHGFMHGEVTRRENAEWQGIGIC